MSAQHTPGEWVVSGGAIYTTDGHFIAKVLIRPGMGADYAIIPDLEGEANAWLMAAAPKLLEALVAYVAELEEQCIALGWSSVEEYRKAHTDRESYALAISAIAAAKEVAS